MESFSASSIKSTIKILDINLSVNLGYVVELNKDFQEQPTLSCLLRRYFDEIYSFIKVEGIQFKYPLLAIDIKHGDLMEAVYSHEIDINLDFWGEITLSGSVKLSTEIIKKVDFITALLIPSLKLKIIEEAGNLYSNEDNLIALAKPQLTEQLITREAKIAFREGLPISVILLDIDRFDRIIQSTGRLQRDKTLYEVLRHIKSTIRETDLITRFKKDSFFIILRGVSGTNAIVISQRICKVIDATRYYVDSSKKPQHITISAGVVQLSSTDSIDSVFTRAKAALQLARNNGRNQSYLADILRIVS
jgi:diguanylate cyclase (GGDEF)-like protein